MHPGFDMELLLPPDRDLSFIASFPRLQLTLPLIVLLLVTHTVIHLALC